MKYAQTKVSDALVSFSTVFSKRSYCFIGSFKSDRRKLYSDYVALSRNLAVGVPMPLRAPQCKVCFVYKYVILSVIAFASGWYFNGLRLELEFSEFKLKTE